jgi:hypothetical protein
MVNGGGNGATLAYIYIDKLLNELRDELLGAMHAAVESEMRGQGRVDVPRLYRAFTRAAAKKMANPVQVSDRCLEEHGVKAKRGAKVKDE